MNSFIIVDPKICSGKPVIRGTRIMVRNILGIVAGGYTVDRILSAYPELTREMVQAVLEYAAAVIDEEQVIAHAWGVSEDFAWPKYTIEKTRNAMERLIADLSPSNWRDCIIIIDNQKIRVRKLK